MTTLIIGGAGYIGSHVAKVLSKSGENTIVFDNLSTGHKELIQWSDFIHGDTKNIQALDKVFQVYNIDTVMHLGDLSIIAESIYFPEAYYENNVKGLINILKCMKTNSIQKIIYSSSAAIYGNQNNEKLNENAPLNPTTPYGKTKLTGEHILEDFFASCGISSISLRYFNAAGADLDTDIGELHENETHLIPNIFKSLTEKESPLKIYGKDYETRDGTCIRDYVHVLDIAEAHILGSKYIDHKPGAWKINLGSGYGSSIMEVIRECERITGKKVPYEVSSSRTGDPSVLIANSSFARTKLKWSPKHSDLETIIQSAWKWYLKVNKRHLTKDL